MFSGGDFDRLNDVQCQRSWHCTSFNLSKSLPENTFMDQTFWGINPSACLHNFKNESVIFCTNSAKDLHY